MSSATVQPSGHSLTGHRLQCCHQCLRTAQAVAGSMRRAVAGSIGLARPKFDRMSSATVRPSVSANSAGSGRKR